MALKYYDSVIELDNSNSKQKNINALYNKALLL